MKKVTFIFTFIFAFIFSTNAIATTPLMDDFTQSNDRIIEASPFFGPLKSRGLGVKLIIPWVVCSQEIYEASCGSNHISIGRSSHEPHPRF